MAGRSEFLAAWTPRMLSVLRIIVAFLFLTHGSQKLLGMPPGPGPTGTVEIGTELGMAGIIELAGGILLLVGLLTRPVAFILAGEMAVAYFKQHAPHSFWPIVNKGELAVLYCFVFLYFMFAGGGSWSLDHLFFKPSPAADEG